MPEPAQILVVEDEQIVAKDIQRTLQRLGYVVPETIDTGAEAVEAAERLRPDLVLMDIRLRGTMDGIVAASVVRERYDIPVIFLTAHADAATLQRAKISEPFGYVLKPFNERDLHSTVEMALYKHRIDRKLRESERWLSVTLSSIGDGIIATDAKGRVVFMNHVAQSLTGWTDQEAAGRPLAEVFRIVNEHTRLPVDDPVASVLATGLIVGLANHTVLIARDGSERPIDDSGAPIRAAGGQLLGVVLVFRDITERRLAEDNLRESEQRFKTLASHAPVGIFQTDANGNCLFVNSRWSELAGLPPDQAQGRGWGEALHPEDRDRIMREWYNAAQQDGEFTAEYRFQRPDGKSTWLCGRAAALRSEEGEITGYIGTIADLSLQKEAEETLRAMDRRKDEFLATLAHELRNPVAPIKSSVAILKSLPIDEPHFVTSRDVIERQVQHMARLLDDLLDVNRITTGKLELRNETISLKSLVESAVEASRPLIDAKEQTLTIALPEAPVHLSADPVRMAQVFSNLLNNAAKYTNHGGQIWLTAECHSTEAVISVKDNGIGLSADMLPRVFDMFSQASPVLDRSDGGLGIGLSLVKGLVELQGGSIVVESDGLGHGSEFTVRLPVITEMARLPRRQLPTKKDVENATKRRLLIVDDVRDGADSLARLMRMMGHEVETAYDGEQAIQMAADLKPNVMLLDIGMPKLNGYEVCRRIRMQPWGKQIFLVALTGWGQDDDRRQAQEAGFDHHMVKPIEAADLSALLATL